MAGFGVTTEGRASASCRCALILLRAVSSKSRMRLYSWPLTSKRHSNFPFRARIGIWPTLLSFHPRNKLHTRISYSTADAIPRRTIAGSSPIRKGLRRDRDNCAGFVGFQVVRSHRQVPQRFWGGQTRLSTLPLRPRMNNWPICRNVGPVAAFSFGTSASCSVVSCSVATRWLPESMQRAMIAHLPWTETPSTKPREVLTMVTSQNFATRPNSTLRIHSKCCCIAIWSWNLKNPRRVFRGAPRPGNYSPFGPLHEPANRLVASTSLPHS